MISRTEQQMRTVYTNLVFNTLSAPVLTITGRRMAFYTFLLRLYNCLLKYISLTILLGKVRKFLKEVLKIPEEMQRRISPHLSPKSSLAINQITQGHFCLCL